MSSGLSKISITVCTINIAYLVNMFAGVCPPITKEAEALNFTITLRLSAP